MFSKKTITIAYAVEKCTKCGNTKKRKFQEGDTLFSDMGRCGSCDGTMLVDAIFGERFV